MQKNTRHWRMTWVLFSGTRKTQKNPEKPTSFSKKAEKAVKHTSLENDVGFVLRYQKNAEKSTLWENDVGFVIRDQKKPEKPTSFSNKHQKNAEKNHIIGE